MLDIMLKKPIVIFFVQILPSIIYIFITIEL